MGTEKVAGIATPAATQFQSELGVRTRPRGRSGFSARAGPDRSRAAAVFLADMVVCTVGALALARCSLGVVASAQVALWIIAPWRAALSRQHGAPVRRVIVSMLAAHFWCAVIDVPFGATTAVLMIVFVVGERSIIQVVIDGLKARGK